MGVLRKGGGDGALFTSTVLAARPVACGCKFASGWFGFVAPFVCAMVEIESNVLLGRCAI
jgi:hypothetical protein